MALLSAAAAAGSLEIRSNTRVDAKPEEGRVTLTLADVRFRPDDGTGWVDRYMRIDGVSETAVISVASVICDSGHLLGFKGFSQSFSQLKGSFDLSELLATGSVAAPMMRISFPWLLVTRDAETVFDLRREPETLCREGSREALKGFNVVLSPKGTSGIFTYEYDAKKRRLDIRWKQKT